MSVSLSLLLHAFFLGALAVFLLSLSVFSAPSEIIIIRHGDKITQHAPGIFLSPRGQVRAEKFIFYFMSHFGRPDYIFTTNPIFLSKGDHAFRAVQTIAPLENYLMQHQVPVTVNSLYHKKDYTQLAQQLLTNTKYGHKKILICWEHHMIAPLVAALQVSGNIFVWPEDDFDSVYVIKYRKDGAIASYQELKNQYPVSVNPSWRSLLNKSMKQGVIHGKNAK